MSALQSGSQTAGPYLHIGLGPNRIDVPMYGGRDLGSLPVGDARERIELVGQVWDGEGAPCTDVMVEVTQPEGFARSFADARTGVWTVQTVRPAAVDGQAPHFTLWLAARGINRGLWTRLYLPGAGLVDDPALVQVPPARRVTLVARQVDPHRFEHEIRLQGPDETVFFEMADG
ncbi:MAG: hypothetical protein KTR31_11250 [Myxococcales bacterium]|nr:hypothetical protein [Myxococcales bacterium]